MLKSFFSFELYSGLRKPLVYLLIAVNFVLMFLAASLDTLTIGFAVPGLFLNSPFSIAMSMVTLSLVFGLFVGLAYANGAAMRDINPNFHGIMFSYPLQRRGYYWGRLLAAWLLTLLPMLGGILGLAVGSMMPFAPAEDFGPAIPGAYLQGIVLFLVPNSFILVALSYSLAVRFRSSTVGFIGTIGILLMYLMAARAVLSAETGNWVVYLDPIGFNTLIQSARYWTLHERNTLLMWTDSLVLLNRGFWLVLSGAIVWWQYRRFSFTYMLLSGKRKKKLADMTLPKAMPVEIKPLPAMQYEDTWLTRAKQYVTMLKMDLKGILTSPPFWVLALLGVVNSLNALSQADGWYNNGSFPVTNIMVEALHDGSNLFLYAIVIFYAGMLVWRERDVHFHGLTDSMPFTVLGRASAKITALLWVTFSLLVTHVILAVLVQLSKGFTAIDFQQYAVEILGLDFLTFAWLAILSVTVQSVLQQKYVAYGVTLVLLLIFDFGLPRLGLYSPLLQFGQLPGFTYSDMNGLGPFVGILRMYALYWSLAALILWGLTARWWVRGHRENWAIRWQKAMRAQPRSKQLALLAALGTFVLCSGFLYYHTVVLNEVQSPREQIARQVLYEQTYNKYQDLPQPRIIAADFEVDMFPSERAVAANTLLTIVNPHEVSIEQVHFTLPPRFDIEVELPMASKATLKDDALGYYIYTLEQPIAPGDTLVIGVRSSFQARGLRDRGVFTKVVENGTFLTNMDLVPALGYQESGQLGDPEERKKNGLSAIDWVMPETATEEDLAHNYISSDADWVRMTTTISTEAGQVAVAPGNLVKEWQEQGRNYFRYELPRRTLFFANFTSAKYEVARRVWTKSGHHPVDLEVYYHPDHAYNVDHMLTSMERSLDYYTEAFGPYQHQQARILEFPRYEEYAQAFPGTMPYSEGAGFITDRSDSTAIDQVFFVVAHELAHQWWAHQVIGANVSGSTFMSESFAQYSALMVMEETYGPNRMKQFLAYERDRYLRGRGRDGLEETALVHNHNQSYIHYRKGSVLMYALQAYIGKEQVNAGLREYLHTHGNNWDKSYSTSLDALETLTAEAPDSLRTMISDMFNKVTLYDNEALEATATEQSDGSYEVVLSLRASKLFADGGGKEEEAPMNDWVAVGLYPEDTYEEPYPAPLVLEYVQLSGDTTLTFEVNELPYRAGIDPNLLLIDRNPEDNMRRVEVASN